MIHVPLGQARNQLYELVGRVECGETVVITRRSKPVARLETWRLDEPEKQRERVLETFERLSDLRRGMTLEGDLKSIARQGLA